MRHARLWPMLTALGAILSGSIALEVVARHQEAPGRMVEVASNDSMIDGEDSSANVEPFGPPLDDDHGRVRQLAKRGEYAEALLELARLVSAHPDQVLLRSEQAHYLLRSGQLDAAIRLLEETTAIAGDDARTWFDLGRARAQRGDTDAALTAFEKALTLRPQDAFIRIAFGELLRVEHDPGRALAVLERATRLGSNESRARALAAVGRCQMQLGETKLAEAAFSQAVLRAPAQVNTWIRIARGYLESDEPSFIDKAIEHASRAVTLNPDLALAQSVLGRAYEKRGAEQEALHAYQDAIRLDAAATYPRERVLRLSMETEDYRLARAQAERLLEIRPERPEYHFLLGLVESHTSKPEAARPHYLRAIELSPKGYAESWFNLGLLERGLGRTMEAKAAYREALRLRPGYRAALNNLGLVHLDEKAFAEAEHAFQEALKLDTRYAAAWGNLGRCYSVQGRFSEAIQVYEQALGLVLEPESRSLELSLAVVLRRAGQGDKAVKRYQSLLEREPNCVAGWYNLGIALSALGRDGEAENAYQRALSHDPNHVKALKNLALLEARIGHSQSAREHLIEALDHDPGDGEMRLELAQLLLAANDRAGCERAARLVLAQQPTSAGAMTLLGRCSAQTGSP